MTRPMATGIAKSVVAMPTLGCVKSTAKSPRETAAAPRYKVPEGMDRTVRARETVSYTHLTLPTILRV